MTNGASSPHQTNSTLRPTRLLYLLLWAISLPAAAGAARYDFHQTWTLQEANIVGITVADWNLNGTPEVLALQAATGELTTSSHVLSTAPQGAMLILDTSGDRTGTFPVNDITGALPIDLRYTQLQPGQSALLHCRDGWPSHVPVIGAGGKILWQYPAKPRHPDAVDSAAWVDTDGDGRTEMLVGFNGGGGLHLIDSDGELLWKNTNFGNVWCVDGIPSSADVSRENGQVTPTMTADLFCTEVTGRVWRLNSSGVIQNAVTPTSVSVTTFAAAEMITAGVRQVVSIERPPQGGTRRYVARDLSGRQLWDQAIITDFGTRIPPPLRAADLTGDGQKEWILQTSPQQLTVVDLNGKPEAILRSDTPFLVWEPLPAHHGRIGGVLVSDKKSLRAYTLNQSSQP